MSIKSKLVADPRIQAKIASTRPKLAQYESTLLESADARFPSHSVQRLKEQLAATSDTAAVPGLMKRIQDLSNPAAAEYAAILTSTCLAAFEPARVEIMGLLNAAKTVLQEYQAGAVSDERDFFQANGLPWEATSVSRQYAKSIAEVDALLATWSRAVTVLPNPDATPLQTFFGQSVV